MTETAGLNAVALLPLAGAAAGVGHHNELGGKRLPGRGSPADDRFAVFNSGGTGGISGTEGKAL